MIRYKTIAELPKGYQAEAQELVDIGALKGRGGDKGLDVTEDMLRVMIICLRMCKALISAIPLLDADKLFESFKQNLKVEVKIQ